MDRARARVAPFCRVAEARTRGDAEGGLTTFNVLAENSPITGTGRRLHPQRHHAQSDQTCQNQVGCHEIVEKLGKNEDQDSENNREQRTQTGRREHHIASCRRSIGKFRSLAFCLQCKEVLEGTNV